MLISLLITGVSAGYLVVALQEKATSTVLLRPVTPPIAPAVQSSESAVPPAEQPIPAQEAQPPSQIQSESSSMGKPASTTKESEEVTPDAATADDKAKGTLFRYRSPNAKDVFIVGDFNKWFRDPMSKKPDGVWEKTVKLAPGSYKYLFIVDGKRTKDPNNRSTSSDGRSVLVVKSQPAKKAAGKSKEK